MRASYQLACHRRKVSYQEPAFTRHPLLAGCHWVLLDHEHGGAARANGKAATYKQPGYSVIAIESERGHLGKGFRNIVVELAP